MERFVIAITRTCGSGGTTIGKKLADSYCIDMYDRQLLRLASEDSGINEALFGNVDEDKQNTLLYKVSKKVYNGEMIPPESGNFTSDINLFNYQAKVLKELAERESYIVIGRGADYILRDNPHMISVFLCADKQECIKHEMYEQCMTEKEAEKYIAKMDKYRTDYYSYHTGKKWHDPANYDLCLNTTKIGYDNCVKIIQDYLEMKLKSEG